MRYSTQNRMLKFGKSCWEERTLNTVYPLVINCGSGGCTGSTRYVPRLLLLPSKNVDFTQAAVGREVLLPRVCVTLPQILTPVSGNFTVSPH